MRAAFVGIHEMPGDGGQIQSIRQILVDIEEHFVKLLRRCWNMVDLRQVLMHRTAERDLFPVAVVTGIVR